MDRSTKPFAHAVFFPSYEFDIRNDNSNAQKAKHLTDAFSILNEKCHHRFISLAMNKRAKETEWSSPTDGLR